MPIESKAPGCCPCGMKGVPGAATRDQEARAPTTKTPDAMFAQNAGSCVSRRVASTLAVRMGLQVVVLLAAVEPLRAQNPCDGSMHCDGTNASGSTATAMGYRTTASGDTATAMGGDTTASRDGHYKVLNPK